MLKSYSERQKMFEGPRTAKSCSQRQRLLKSYRAQSGQAYSYIEKNLTYLDIFWSFIKNQFVCWHRTWPCTESQFRKLVFWANPLIIYQSRLTSRDCLKGWVHLISVQKSFSYFISNVYVFIPRWKGEIKIWFFVEKVELWVSTCQSLMYYKFFTSYSQKGTTLRF